MVLMMDMMIFANVLRLIQLACDYVKTLNNTLNSITENV